MELGLPKAGGNWSLERPSSWHKREIILYIPMANPTNPWTCASAGVVMTSMTVLEEVRQGMVLASKVSGRILVPASIHLLVIREQRQASAINPEGAGAVGS